MRDTEREAETQAEEEAGSIAGARCELDPGTPGSCPEPKSDAQLLSHPGISGYPFFIQKKGLCRVLHSKVCLFSASMLGLSRSVNRLTSPFLTLCWSVGSVGSSRCAVSGIARCLPGGIVVFSVTDRSFIVYGAFPPR